MGSRQTFNPFSGGDDPFAAGSSLEAQPGSVSRSSSHHHVASSASSQKSGTGAGGMILYHVDRDNGPSRRSSISESHLLESRSIIGEDSKYPAFHTKSSSSISSGAPRQRQASQSGPHAAHFNNTQSSISSVPVPGNSTARGPIVAYQYDPTMDTIQNDPEDRLHDPRYSKEETNKFFKPGGGWNWRGTKNIGALVVLMLALLSLFLILPIVLHFKNADAKRAASAAGSLGGTPKAPDLGIIREPVDQDTPTAARTRTGFNGEEYELVFSDEFNTPGRTFYAGDDPYLEAMDIWYGVTEDLEYYDPRQVITRDGALVMTMDTNVTRTPKLTPGSSAPYDAEKDNHGFQFRSGMIQSWNKFCFTGGYIEVSVILPGKSSHKQYWPGAWTMGNLGRPGYRATTDGTWPYSYDECDVGTFPNQTLKDGSGPAAALAFGPKKGEERFDHKLSVLRGQRLSACTCPNSDHPGPFGKFGNEDKPRYRGRGAPEIDILEVQHAGVDATGIGSVASQSAQFAPFAHDWVIDESGQTIFDPSVTEQNGFLGTALQQAVSGLTKVPDEGFQLAPNRRFVTYGFEYKGDPNDRENGYITWQVDGKKSISMTPKAVGPDRGADGSGIGQRIVPEEPMSIILNLGISHNWGALDISTLDFPAEMMFDYIRVYQPKGKKNIGCNPPDFPTSDYIEKHLDQYTVWDTKRIWEKEVPKNRLYDGCPA